MPENVKWPPDTTCPACKLRFVVQFYAKSTRSFKVMQPIHCPNCGHRFRWSRG